MNGRLICPSPADPIILVKSEAGCSPELSPNPWLGCGSLLVLGKPGHNSTAFGRIQSNFGQTVTQHTRTWQHSTGKWPTSANFDRMFPPGGEAALRASGRRFRRKAEQRALCVSRRPDLPSLLRRLPLGWWSGGGECETEGGGISGRKGGICLRNVGASSCCITS